MRGHITAHPIQELHRPRAVQRQLHVFQHLAVAHLHHHEQARIKRQALELHLREGIKRDGPQHAHLQSCGTRFGGHGLQNAAHNAITHQHNLCVARAPFFGAGFALLGHLVLGLEIAVVLLQLVAIEMQRSNEIGARGRGSGHRPRGQMRRRCRLRKLHRLHHLADESVGHQHHRVAIAIGQVEGQRGQVRHLLHGVRSQHNGAVVAVAAALHHLVIIALLGGDVAQPRTAAGDIGDYAGQFRAGHIAHALLHQTDAGTARSRHGAHTRRRRAVKHVDGRDLALRLHVYAAGFGHKLRRSLGNLAGRRDGISVERPAASQDGAFHDGLVALHQLFLHAAAPPNPDLVAPPFSAASSREKRESSAPTFGAITKRSTVIAPGSGHAMKQMPHAVQPEPAYNAVR